MRRIIEMNHDLPVRTVSAIFADRVSAEIACALLSDASIRSDEPAAIDDSSWGISVGVVGPDLAKRAEVILRSAGARAPITIVRGQTAV